MQSGPLWRIHNPRIRPDNVGGWIPIAVFIQSVVKAVAVVHVRSLRELDRAVCCNLQMIESDFGHLLIGLHFLRWQSAGTHAYDLLVAYLGGNRVVAYLADFMLAVLVELRAE